MNTYLQEAKEFYKKNPYRTKKTFEQEAKEFKAYSDCLKKLEEEEGEEVVRLAIQYIGAIKERSYLKNPHHPKNVDMINLQEIRLTNKLYSLTRELSNEDTQVIIDRIFGDVLQSAHGITDKDVRDSWLDLQIEKHSQVLTFNSEDQQKTKRGRPLNQAISQERIQEIVTECINNERKNKRFIHQTGKYKGKANRNQIYDFIAENHPNLTEEMSKRRMLERIKQALPPDM